MLYASLERWNKLLYCHLNSEAVHRKLTSLLILLNCEEFCKSKLRRSENTIFILIKLIIRSAIIFSKIFEKIGSNEMGRKSFIVFGDDIFGIGITMADLNIS